MELKKIYYLDDFDFIVKPRDAAGVVSDLSQIPFEVIVATDGKCLYTATAGEGTAIPAADGSIHVYVNNHRLAPGRVTAQLIADLPIPGFPDRHRRIQKILSSPLELTTTPGDSTSEADIVAMMPYLPAGSAAEIPSHKTINGEEITGEGDIEISTLTPWQRSYLERQESTERTGKYSVSLGLSPSATEFTGAAVALTLTVTAKFDGVKVAAEITPNTSNLNGITFANDKAEVIWPAPAISQGSVSVSYGVKAKYTDSDGSIEKTATASQTRYAPMRWVCKPSDSVPTSDEIKAGVKTVKSSAAGTYSIPFSQGDYVWLCIPAFMNISKVTSGGFDVPVEASQPAICRIGSCDVSYKCVRISGRPQTSPISLTIA